MSCECEYFGQVGQNRVVAEATFTPDLAAHTAGDVLSPAMTFPKATISTGCSGVIEEVTLFEKAVGAATQKGEMDLILYSGIPTLPVPNEAWTAPATATDILAVIPIPAASWKDLTSLLATVTVRPEAPYSDLAAAASIYGALVTRGTQDYAADAQITCRLRFRRD